MSIKFCKCGEEIHPLRIKVLPHTTTCVKCSTERPKKGFVTTVGEGDHCYNDLEIVSEETYNKLRSLETSRGLAVEHLVDFKEVLTTETSVEPIKELQPESPLPKDDVPVLDWDFLNDPGLLDGIDEEE